MTDKSGFAEFESAQTAGRQQQCSRGPYFYALNSYVTNIRSMISDYKTKTVHQLYEILICNFGGTNAT